jgi:hypothetical protein
MRTKTLLCAAALAAGVVSSMAQSNVYSLNVVGYVNVPLKGGINFNLLGNPLNNTASNGNNITNLFTTAASDGDQVFTWNPAIQDLGATVYTYSIATHSWDGNRVMNPGEGFFYLATGSNVTNTFVGDVIQGSYTNPVSVLGNISFNLFASSIPIGGSHTNATVGIVSADGDQVYTWDVNIQDLSATIATYSIATHTWDNTAIAVPPGNGFFYLATGPNQTTWVRNFTVQ